MRILATVSIACTIGLASGCGVLERAACGEPCEGGWSPAAGSAEGFTFAGQHDEGAAVSEPAPCESEYGGDVSLMHVTTSGASVVDTETWVTDRLMPEMLARDLRLPVRTLGVCLDPNDEEISYTLALSDWSEADPLVDIVLELAHQDDVAFALSVGIEAQPTLCPDDACGV